MKSKFGKVLCTAVSAAAVVGGIAYVVKNILNKEEDDMDLEDVTVEEDDEQFEEIFSDENKDEREYVSINITDEQEVVEETEEAEKTEEEDTESLEYSEQE